MNISKLLKNKEVIQENQKLTSISGGVINDNVSLESIRSARPELIYDYLNSINSSINTLGEKTFRNINQEIDINDFKLKTGYNKLLNISDEDMINLINIYEFKYNKNGI